METGHLAQTQATLMVCLGQQPHSLHSDSPEVCVSLICACLALTLLKPVTMLFSLRLFSRKSKCSHQRTHHL